MLFIFSMPVLIRHLWQLKTVVFLHWCLICAVLLDTCAIDKFKLTGHNLGLVFSSWCSRTGNPHWGQCYKKVLFCTRWSRQASILNVVTVLFRNLPMLRFLRWVSRTVLNTNIYSYLYILCCYLYLIIN
jgi:hypothetical protein